MPTFQEFQEFDLRVGTVVSAKPHPTARKPSIQLDVDFGDGDLKRSSAQLTTRYAPEDLVGRQIIAVTNFPARKVGDYESHVLVLGAMVTSDDVVLLNVDWPVPNGTRIA